MKDSEKIMLLGTGNDRYRHYYKIRKNEKFKKIFVKFMEDLGFDAQRIKQQFWNEDNNIEIKISDFIDSCSHYKNKKYDIDIFYGYKKIILVIRTKERKELLENIKSKFKWKNKNDKANNFRKSCKID